MSDHCEAKKLLRDLKVTWPPDQVKELEALANSLGMTTEEYIADVMDA